MMSPQQLFDEADGIEAAGQQERALGLWRQLAETHPSRNVFLRLARITKKLGLIGDAESAFKHALEIDSRSAIALISLGILAIDRRDYEAAGSYLKKAAEIKKCPEAFTLLGVALKNTGKRLDAEEAYRSAIRIDPKYEEAYYNLGALLKHDRPSEARALFRTALELDPDYACAHRELGYLSIKHGANPETEGHLRRAIQLEPRDAWAHVYLGTYLWRCTDVDGAVAEFQIARELKPEWTVPLWSLGNIYESESIDLDLAQALFERVLQLEPDDATAIRGLGRVFKKRGQTDLAREYLGRALLLDPRDDKSRELLSELSLRDHS